MLRMRKCVCLSVCVSVCVCLSTQMVLHVGVRRCLWSCRAVAPLTAGWLPGWLAVVLRSAGSGRVSHSPEPFEYHTWVHT